MNQINSKYFLPFVFLGLLSGLLFKGLSLNPKALPSALINKPLPKIEKTSLMDSNHKVSSDDLKGKYWLLHVWASWCQSCLEEHANLFSLTKLPIIGLNYQDEKKDALDFINRYGNPYTDIISDRDGKFGIELGVYGTPETFLIGPDGKVKHRFAGVITASVWQQQFERLIHG